MKLMSKIVVASLASTLTVSAMAEVSQPSALPVAQTEVADLSYAFGDSQNLQVQVMTVQEMDETEGAWGVPGAVAGAGIGAWGYLGGAAGSGKFSWGGLAVATAGGAAMGAITGPVGIGRYYATARIAGASGFIGSRF